MKTVLQLSIAMQRRSRLCLRTVLFFALLAGSAGAGARAANGPNYIDLAENLTADANNTGWYYTHATKIYTITGDVTVTGSNSNQRRIAVSGTVTVTLNGVTIQNLDNDQSAFSLNSGANVTLHLSSGTTNTLKGAGVSGAGALGAGVHVPQGASIAIDGDGTLSAIGDFGAGIGGNGARGDSSGETAGNITVNGGTVIATGQRGAGIGGGGHHTSDGGNGGNGGTFTMNGGNVTASSTFGAGIGGGLGYAQRSNGVDGGSGGTIVINGGTLDASSGNSAGIGGGQGSGSSWYNGRGGSGGNITINGGYIKANGNSSNAVGIGGGMSDQYGTGSSAGTITINGGTIELTGSNTIGCVKNAGGTIIINGGSIINGTCNLTPVNYANTTVVKVPMLIGSAANANKPVTAGAIGSAACYSWPYTKETGGQGGYGIYDVKADADGKVYFWLPESTAEKIILEANSTQYSATFARSNGMGEQTLAQNSETLPTPKKVPEASDFTFTPPTSVTYDGNPHPVSVTCSTSGMGTFEVLYNNSSSDAPVAVGSYSVDINVAEGTEYIARNFSIGSFSINRRSISSAEVTVTGSRVYTGAQLQPDFTVEDTGAPITTGDYYAYLWGTNINPGTNAGSVRIFAQGNYTGSRMVYFDIEKATLTVTAADTARLIGEPNPAFRLIYTGFVNGEDITALTALPVASTAAIPASPAGTYPITVSGGAADNYAFACVPGTLTVTGLPPSDAGLSFDLTKTPVEVTVPAGVTGLGEITVKYNGRTTVPTEPGTYEVTVDIAEGAVYAGVTGIVVGTITIPEPVYPPTTPTLREVILLALPGVTTDPPAGSYYLPNGSDFVFTLTPAAAQTLLTPVITTDAGSSVEITPNADGTYTVRIRQVRRSLTIAIDFTTAGEVISGNRVWSHAGTLCITAAINGEARIYSVSGRLAKAIPVAAGATTNTPLPAGFYVVVLGGKPYKVFVE
jgi:hypothetical protein